MMNTNEECLIKYISFTNGSAGDSLHYLINFLLNHNFKFAFNDLNPVCNIIDELEFVDKIK